MSARPPLPAVAVGSDHGGFELKQALVRWLASRGHALHDAGSHDGSPCDYPTIAAAVARHVANGACRFGIVVDGAGIGSAIAANKVPGVRAALCYDLSTARNAREHNDANVLTLGARLIGPGLAEQIVEAFLSTECTEERHRRRVALIDELERSGSPAARTASPPPSGLYPAGKPDQASASRPADDPKSRAFRARASERFGHAPPSPMSELDRLCPEDIDRVAARLAELLGAPESRAGAVCFGEARIDPAVAQQWIGAGVARFSNGLGHARVRDICSYIDHTLLKPDATEQQIRQLCAEAREHRFAAVCVNPYWVKLCASLLGGSAVQVCTVVGFPLGANVPEQKAMEARRAIRDGAGEIDMVINIGALKAGDDALVFRDIRGVVDACEDGRALCKVILETALLEDEEKVRACVLAKKARADFVKTSTGFASGGATADDVTLMSRAVAGTRMGVKASGGVRNYADFEDMVRAGATRIGASAGVKIVKEAAEA